MLPGKTEFYRRRDELKLEQCPCPVQVMPAEKSLRRCQFALTILGNVAVGALLLTGLMLWPAWLGLLVF